MTKPRRWVTTREAAQWTGRHIDVIQKWVRDGEIPAIQKDGKSNLVDLTAAIEAHVNHGQHGRRLRNVEFTLKNGTVVTRAVRTLSRPTR